MLWVVLDTHHRPELLPAIQQGAPCVLPCESCKNPIKLNTPFLVVRTRSPRLLYCPSPGTTSVDDHNQVVDLLRRIKEGMGDLWNDEILEELVVVPPSLLCAELNSDPAAPAHSIAHLVDAFIQADTTWKQQYMLARYPAIYEAHDDAVAILAQKLDEARSARDVSMVACLRMLRGMLAGCREAGASTIRSLVPSPKVYQPATELNDLLLSIAHAMRTGERTDAIPLLSYATANLTQEENPLLWTEIPLILVELDDASDADQSFIAREACEAVAEATFPCGPWLMRLAEAHAKLAALCEVPALAINHYESALNAFEKLGRPHQKLAIYDALGHLHSMRTNGDRASHIDDGLRCFKLGAMCVDVNEDPSNWAAMQFNVGNAYLERLSGTPRENLQFAMFHLKQAAIVQCQLKESDRVQETAGRLQLAERRALELHRSDPRNGDLSQAIGALEKQDWEGALAAYRSAIAKTEDMLASAYSEAKRREVFSDFGTAYSAAAYICFRLGRFGEAIALLEAGRSRVLSEEMQAFDIAEEKLPAPLREELHTARLLLRNLRATKFILTRPDPKAADLEERMNRSAWQEWRAVLEKIKEAVPEAICANVGERELIALAPEGGALIVPVLSIVGCCVLVVPHGRSTLSSEDIAWIDDFTDNHLIKMLLEWMGSQDLDDRAKRRTAVTATCEQLWQVLVRHVAERLAALKLAPGAPVTFLPQGGLGAFPLHAAEAKADSRTTLLDAYSVSYAPSAYLLSVMQRRAAKEIPAEQDFLGVVDPLGDLDYGRAEGALVSSLFAPERVALLEGSAASGHNLKEAGANRKYVHLCCHAYYTPSGGNYSGLYLAHDAASKSNEELRAHMEAHSPLEDFFFAGQRWIVFNLDLTQCRLVTLSACESGRADAACPDEFLGLPAAFLRAGAAAVASTLWRVDDVAAMLITRRLYEGLVHDHLSPARALRQAQLWLRDATNQTLYRFYRALRDQNIASVQAQQMDRELRRHALGAPGDRPYSHPYYWAAFVVFGGS